MIKAMASDSIVSVVTNTLDQFEQPSAWFPRIARVRSLVLGV